MNIFCLDSALFSNQIKLTAFKINKILIIKTFNLEISFSYFYNDQNENLINMYMYNIFIKYCFETVEA